MGLTISNRECSIGVTKHHSPTFKPVGISFHCKRLVKGLNNKIKAVFNRAISGLAHLDMRQSVLCSHEKVTGDCGNKRGALSECRCKVLDRVASPYIRKQYEDKVIEACLNIIRLQPKKNFKLKLAIFCSGQLLGEQILLFRLFHSLKKEGYTGGSLELFFLDHCYEESILRSDTTKGLKEAVGSNASIAQFITEIGECAPKGISVQGCFFSDSKAYINLAKAHEEYRHDVLIGADIENAAGDMGEIGKEAGKGNAPITLVKVEDSSRLAKPLICELKDDGKLMKCVPPSEKKEVREEIPMEYIIEGIVLAIAAALLATYAIKHFRKT